MTDYTVTLPETLAEDIDRFSENIDKFFSGEIAPAVFKAERVPRGIYEQRQDGTYMLRLRAPGGRLTADQGKVLAELSSEYAEGRLHATTRQDMQLHGIDIKDAPLLMRKLLSAGLTSKGGGGNTVRNVAACPFAGLCRAETFDVMPYAIKTTEYLINLQGSYNLPRKYKIAFSGCPTDCALSKINDLGFIAAVKDRKPGFAVYIAGGMGAVSREADLIEEWIPAADVIRIAEAVRRIFDRHGDRKNRNRARLRFVIERLGRDKFFELYHMEKSAVAKELPELTIETEIRESSHTDFNPQAQSVNINGYETVEENIKGNLSVVLNLPLGFIPADEFAAISDIAERFSADRSMRLSRQQNVIITSVSENSVQQLTEELEKLSTNLKYSAIRNFTACAGASTCRLGMCLSRNAASAAAAALEKYGSELGEVAFNISGCPNSCGQHGTAAIGFFGASRRNDDHIYPAYQVVTGASLKGNRAKLAAKSGFIPAKRMPMLLTQIADNYIDERGINESFCAFLETKSHEWFTSIIENLSSNLPDYNDDPDFYKDWGLNEDFSLADRGAGECSAGVFEVIQTDLAAANKALESFSAPPSSEEVFELVIPAARSLLIVKGITVNRAEAVLKSFTEEFIETGLAASAFRPLLLKTAAWIKDNNTELCDEAQNAKLLLERVNHLYSQLNASLEFAVEKITPESANEEADSSRNHVTLLDLSGVACPMNFVKTKLKLETMSSGDTLSVVLDDGAPIMNVPASLKNEGHSILESKQLSSGEWTILVKKK